MAKENTPIIVSVLFIIICSIFVSIGGSPMTTKPFKVAEPTPEHPPTPTPVVLLTAKEIYSPAQIATIEKLFGNNSNLLATLSFPKKSATKSSLTSVYLIDCEVTNDEIGIKLRADLHDIPKTSQIAKATIDTLARLGYGGFPKSDDITAYAKASDKKFKNNLSGVNQAKIDKNGVLYINFFDSVRAYGGGSSRVGCMNLSTILTAFQFPTVSNVYSCIDKYPTAKDDCSMDFQP
jgi:hypothetical protein